LLGRSSIEACEQLPADRREVGTCRDRYQFLPANALSPRLDTALVMARARPRKAGLEDVVRHHCLESRGQRSLRSGKHAGNSGLEIVVRGAMRDCAEVSEGANVPIEEAHLIL